MSTKAAVNSTLLVGIAASLLASAAHAAPPTKAEEGAAIAAHKEVRGGGHGSLTPLKS